MLCNVHVFGEIFYCNSVDVHNAIAIKFIMSVETIVMLFGRFSPECGHDHFLGYRKL